MHSKTIFVTCLLLSLMNNGYGMYKMIANKKSGVVFKYMEEIRGESSLRECGSNEACSAVHKRFWTSTLVERLCRCPGATECPWKWTKKLDKSSMILNNRSHLKFCRSVAEKETCDRKQTAVIIHGKGDARNTYMIPHNVTVNCICPRSHYWRLQKYSIGDEDRLDQEFRCAKQRMCESLDFCGYVRADLFSIYYRCTCPIGHLCIHEEKSLENVPELLYSGPVYKARCYPY